MTLDHMPDNLSKDLKYWKERCVAAEYLIEHVLTDNSYKRTWAYKKWMKLKNKKGDK